MNNHVNTISGRLSLRQPQRDSLEILARITEIISLKKDRDLTADMADGYCGFAIIMDCPPDTYVLLPPIFRP